MELVAEQRVGYTLGLEFNFPRFHSLVAVAAVASNAEGRLVVVAGTAGRAFFHFGHGDAFFPAGDHFPIVTALALAAGLGNVQFMTEERLACTLWFIYYVARISLVAADTFLLIGDAEGLDAGVTGAARFGFFHLRHGEMPGLSNIEYCIMTNPAIVVIFRQMDIMAEYHRVGVFDFEQDVLRFFC